MTAAFGRIISGHDVENAVVATVGLWAPDYLAEAAELSGRPRGGLAGFASFVRSMDLDRFDEEQTPSCIVVCPGLQAPPVRHGRGKYTASFSVAVGVVVAGQDRDNTLELVQWYAAAVRSMMVQHGSLGGFADDTKWTGERYDDLPAGSERTIAVATVQFEVLVGDVIDAGAGPGKPSVDPTVEPPAPGTVQRVYVTAQGRSQ